MTREELIQKLETTQGNLIRLQQEPTGDERDQRCQMAQAQVARLCIVAAAEGIMPELVNRPKDGEPVTAWHWKAICEALQAKDPTVLRIDEVHAMPANSSGKWFDHAVEIVGTIIGMVRTIAPKWTPAGPTMTRKEIMAHHGVTTQSVTRAWQRHEFEGDGEAFDAAGAKRWKPKKSEAEEAVGVENRKAEIREEKMRPRARHWTCKGCGDESTPSIRPPDRCPKCGKGAFQ